MTASITYLATYCAKRPPRHSPPSTSHHQQKVLVMPHTPSGPSAEELLASSTNNLVRLLVHCATEGMRPKDVEAIMPPPLRIALDYCIPDVVHELLNTTTDPVPVSRQAWVAASTKALFGRFHPETEDDIYFLVEQLDKAIEFIDLELHQRESFPHGHN